MSDDILGDLFGLKSVPQTDIELWLGDCRDVLRGLPADHFHTCVTSPPYFGLRDYGQDKQIGLEPTPDEFVDAMVQVFREVRRVLRPDGTLWLNLGDSYSAARSYQVPSTKGGPKHGPAQSANGRGSKVPDGLKPKDLIGIPWRVAFALQKDGWWLRQDIIWSKANPLPESVTDRCTKAHEYIFLLTKSDRYFFDSKAIAEPTDPSKWGLRSDGSYGGTDLKDYEANGVQKPRSVKERLAAKLARGEGLTRNKRSVWSVSAKPFKGAHFATFPPDLIRPCVLAGASEKGCCPTCGKPWRRVTERMPTGWDGSEYGQRAVDATGGAVSGGVRKSTLGSGNGVGTAATVTRGWSQDCVCAPAEPVPCRVLDPFGGAGTTALVAAQEGRAATLIELNPDYRGIAHKRLVDAKLKASIALIEPIQSG